MMELAYAGGTLRVHDAGAGAPVVLLHGSFSTASAWRRVGAALGAVLGGGFRVLAPDLPGYGASTVPDDGGVLEHYLAAVGAVADHAGAPVHLVGHSAGGCIALAAAIAGAVAPASLTLIDATAVQALRLTGHEAAATDVRAMFDAYRAAHEAGDTYAARAPIDYWTGAGAFDALPEGIRDYVAATTPQNFRDWRVIWEDATPAAAYGAMTAPTLVVTGSASTAPVAAIGQALETLLPNARAAAVPGASHFSISTHPEAVAGLIAEHVSRTSSA